ncbi:hypothetical protein [Pleomorphomonas carboxyditropha]|uniref:hypothetical protein n=1 Tax=Pleomorphomonas carboxyditropha TaxID=2023338 RepID=UPI001055A386|nr:hypothetical protein [Pleomorphomonas carboxyditropha]
MDQVMSGGCGLRPPDRGAPPLIIVAPLWRAARMNSCPVKFTIVYVKTRDGSGAIFMNSFGLFSGWHVCALQLFLSNLSTG